MGLGVRFAWDVMGRWRDVTWVRDVRDGDGDGDGDVTVTVT